MKSNLHLQLSSPLSCVLWKDVWIEVEEWEKHWDVVPHVPHPHLFHALQIATEGILHDAFHCEPKKTSRLSQAKWVGRSYFYKGVFPSQCPLQSASCARPPWYSPNHREERGLRTCSFTVEAMVNIGVWVCHQQTFSKEDQPHAGCPCGEMRCRMACLPERNLSWVEVAAGSTGIPGLHERYSNSSEMLMYSECLELTEQGSREEKGLGSD